MPLFLKDGDKIREVKNLKLLTKKNLSPTFEEEAVRSRVAALDNTELEWAIDELTKRGRIRGTVII